MERATLRACRPFDALSVGIGFIVTSPQGGGSVLTPHHLLRSQNRTTPAQSRNAKGRIVRPFADWMGHGELCCGHHLKHKAQLTPFRVSKRNPGPPLVRLNHVALLLQALEHFPWMADASQGCNPGLGGRAPVNLHVLNDLLNDDALVVGQAQGVLRGGSHGLFNCYLFNGQALCARRGFCYRKWKKALDV